MLLWSLNFIVAIAALFLRKDIDIRLGELTVHRLNYLHHHVSKKAFVFTWVCGGFFATVVLCVPVHPALNIYHFFCPSAARLWETL